MSFFNIFFVVCKEPDIFFWEQPNDLNTSATLENLPYTV